MQNFPQRVTWNANGVPVSTKFDDPYFSSENGLEETRHVFLRGNRLPERFHDGFNVAELGFGTGLNFLTTVLAWRGADVAGQLQYTSFEAYPLSVPQLERALRAFPALDEISDTLLEIWRPTGGIFEFGKDVLLNVVIGDANSELSRWPQKADAWYLDGFSPVKNPELWNDSILMSVADHTSAEGTFATYTAAGFVRRSLAAAGFDVSRSKGFGRKRHMTTGFLAGKRSATPCAGPD